MSRRLALLAIFALACSAPDRGEKLTAGEPVTPAPRLQPIDSPAGAGAMAPSLVEADGAVWLSWLEPTDEGYSLRAARFDGRQWSPPVEIARGDDFFANWADVPKIGVAGDGTLWAHWLAKLGASTYAYGIQLARSDDGGESWEPQGLLHAEDSSPTEHGFVSYAAEGESLRAVWLDGREMEREGPMAVRTAVLGSTVGGSEVLDERVCECCPTELVATAGGAVAFYRDRGDTELRNIARVAARGETWSDPAAVWDDGWTIPGCPVNGPAAVADGDRVAIAWFTAPEGDARIRWARSTDGGDTFSEPFELANVRPLGRVDLAHGVGDELWLSWIEQGEKDGGVMIARLAEAGELERHEVAVTGASRASGIPRLARLGESLLVVWVATEDDRVSGLRMARVAL